ncbi:MAG: hypothetical protein GY757_21810 [bacterium]|nr:hypothetical protein [bacterium]
MKRTIKNFEKRLTLNKETTQSLSLTELKETKGKKRPVVTAIINGSDMGTCSQ